MTKYIFITGGVVSSLGKGIVCSSLGSLLDARKFNITFLKLDPYINVDPGTMNPLQHGEVFVTSDGRETDLDLGHYERFVDITLSTKNSFTTGTVYENVIKKERKGEYLGETIQVIPHITNEIKKLIYKGVQGYEIAIIEIGGTVGDIESLPFLEAMRQIALENDKEDTLFIHLTLLPFLPTTQELKTKPTQHSVKELLSLGIQPDILICRSQFSINKKEKEKIALFTNIKYDDVFESTDVKSIYELPEYLYKQKLDIRVLEKLNLKLTSSNLKKWQQITYKLNNLKFEVTIALVGKYTHLKDSYKSLNEAILHAGINSFTKVNIKYIDSEKLDISSLSHLDGVIIPGGFGNRGIEGKIATIKYLRENDIPFFGICLGMQVAIIEFARNVCNFKNANSTEFDKKTKHPVIALINEWTNEEGINKKYDKNVDLGNSMRLGAQTCLIQKNTKTYNIYGKTSIKERHRHRYEVNKNFINDLTNKGLVFSGYCANNNLVEIIELPEKKWFLACQFHPEFISNPHISHPLFLSFIKECNKNKK